MLDRYIVAGNGYAITAADKGAMLLCDSQVVPLLQLPAPEDFGEGFIGFQKTDPWAPPIKMYQPAGLFIDGWDGLWLMMHGDNYIVGCDGAQYRIAAFNTVRREVTPIHRTFVSNFGAEVYTVKRSDHSAISRVDPRICSASVMLPAPSVIGYHGAAQYRDSFFVGVEKVQPTPNYIDVVPPPDRQINNMGPGVPYRIQNPNGFNEVVWFDFDSAEWKVTGAYTP